MNCYEYRQQIAAQWFLSSISLDGDAHGLSRPTLGYKNGQRGHGFIATDEDDDEDDKSGLEFAFGDRISSVGCQSGLLRPCKSSRAITRKNVCFNEVFQESPQHSTVGPRRLLSAPEPHDRSPPPKPRLSQTEYGLLNQANSTSFRYAISTMSLRRPPLVMASVIPLSRDPLMQSGITKGPNGTPLGGVGSKQRSAPETPGALLNSLFRHTANNATRSGSLAQDEILASTSLPVAKPLSHIKPVDSVDRSYAHFLVPHNSLHQWRNSHRRGRRRAETVGGDELPGKSAPTPVTPNSRTAMPTDSSASACGGGQYRSRSQTLSFSNVASPISKSENSPLQDGALAYNVQSVEVTAYPSSSENIESIQPVVYDDPLINYNPLLLDDPMAPRVTNRRVFPFQGYVTSILGYRRPDEHKKSLNREFHQRFPNVQLTLTKMRSLKLNLLSVALRMNLDLWIVAHAYVLFEKIILKLFVCKSNRKLCAGAALLISAKLNDLKGPALPVFIQEIESELRISHRDLLRMEMAVFIGLEFCVLPSPSETQPHFSQIQKYLGVVSVPRRPSNGSHSFEDEHFFTTSMEFRLE
ncbi:CDK5 and ABL1 enzyme substrate 2 [Taenia crassiceps]|uniref:CDK5 and ABL1 enzyme substrate 2 n=1 Tax=Taenia crassiceps TaxID=6207 RepID=A0ABR4QA91_9CEST